MANDLYVDEMNLPIPFTFFTLNISYGDKCRSGYLDLQWV